MAEEGGDGLEYDLLNLAAFDYNSVQFKGDGDKESILLENIKTVTQFLVQRIFECPIERSDVGPVAVLPEEKTKIPREKRIPEPKPLTRWEQFAKEKGIKNQKRERMVYDEQTDEYKPRFGYKRVKNGLEDQPIVEVKTGQDPFADPWAEDRKEKKERVEKNIKNRAKNNLRRSGGKSGNVLAYDPARVPGIPVDIAAGGGNAKRGKDGVRKTLQLVQHSTASMGRFDTMRHGEPVRKIVGKKRSFKDNFADGKEEKANMKAQIRIVADKVDKKSRGVTNSLAPYEGILPDAPGDSFKQKKGKGKQSNNKEKKSSKKRKG